MDQPADTFRSRLGKDRLCLCMAITHARSADVPLIARASGFDAFYLDLEHYPTSLETAATICTAALAADIVPFVRVPSREGHIISRVLDCGASGVIVPHVDDAATARAIVDAARFPPLGNRGFPGPNAHTRFIPRPAASVVALMDAKTVVAVMLESPQAIAAAADIAAVPGIDILLIGSNDLTLAMGIPGELHSPRLFSAFADVAAACRRHGKTLGVAGVRDDMELASRLIGLGGRFVIAGSDTGYLLSAATAGVAAFRTIKLPS